MKIDFGQTKYEVKYTTSFKKDLSKLIKQGKDFDKLKSIIIKLANGENLEKKYLNHHLINNRLYTGCSECHVEPDWLLVYKIQNEELLLLCATGSHSELFK